LYSSLLFMVLCFILFSNFIFLSFMATFKHWQTNQAKVEPKDCWI
jgi:hypothetical protein